MIKLTASRCRVRINELRFTENNHGLSNQGYDYLEALEIALPVLEQEELAKQVDLISTPQHVLDEKWNSQFGVRQQPSTTPKIDNDGWIEWGGGKCPIDDHDDVEVKFRDGVIEDGLACHFIWGEHDGIDAEGDIIAYRVIENDGREG